MTVSNCSAVSFLPVPSPRHQNTPFSITVSPGMQPHVIVHTNLCCCSCIHWPSRRTWYEAGVRAFFLFVIFTSTQTIECQKRTSSCTPTASEVRTLVGLTYTSRITVLQAPIGTYSGQYSARKLLRYYQTGLDNDTLMWVAQLCNYSSTNWIHAGIECVPMRMYSPSWIAK